MESFAYAVEVNLRGWEGNRRSGGSVVSIVALLRAVSGQRVAPDHRVPDGGGGQQAESRRDGVVRRRDRGEAALYRAAPVVDAVQGGRRHGRGGRRHQEGALPLVRPHRPSHPHRVSTTWTFRLIKETDARMQIV